MAIDPCIKEILSQLGLDVNEHIHELIGSTIPREDLLSPLKYEAIKPLIVKLKNVYSSSELTSLHVNASVKQSFPLLNLLRQILRTSGMHLQPVRLCDGYENGKKKFRRVFVVSSI